MSVQPIAYGAICDTCGRSPEYRPEGNSVRYHPTWLAAHEAALQAGWTLATDNSEAICKACNLCRSCGEAPASSNSGLCDTCAAPIAAMRGDMAVQAFVAANPGYSTRPTPQGLEIVEPPSLWIAELSEATAPVIGKAATSIEQLPDADTDADGVHSCETCRNFDEAAGKFLARIEGGAR